MSNIATFTPIVAGETCRAATVQSNFDKIASAINSNALNSDNYGLSAVVSANISNSAIESQHFANSQIGYDKISETQVINHNMMNFNSSDGGVMVMQLGGTDSTGYPASGVRIARLTKAISITDEYATWAPISFGISFSDAVDGNPQFTTTPVFLGVPAIEIGDEAIAKVTSQEQWWPTFSGAWAFGPINVQIKGVNSVSCELWLRHNVAISSGAANLTGTYVATVHMAMEGAV